MDNKKKTLIINVLFTSGLFGTNLEPFSDGFEAIGEFIIAKIIIPVSVDEITVEHLIPLGVFDSLKIACAFILDSK